MTKDQQSSFFSDQGTQVRERVWPFLLILKSGESLHKAATQFFTEAKLPGAYISGIGAVKDVEIGVYDIEAKQYRRQSFPEHYELTSLTGNLSLKDGDYFVHWHAALSDFQYKTIGGHLFDATVTATCELFVHPLTQMPQREYDDKVGLKLIRH